MPFGIWAGIRLKLARLQQAAFFDKRVNVAPAINGGAEALHRKAG